MRRIVTTAFLLSSILFSVSCKEQQETALTTFPLKQVTVNQELSQRIHANFQRLNSDIYQPPAVFEDKGWPGDYIGRTILGLVLDSEALHCGSPLMKTLVNDLPSHLNEKGYLGPDYYPAINEQQLSGHGWLLRGLCEYSKMTGDKEILKTVSRIAENLFVAGKEKYSSYPISSGERTTEGGEAAGSVASQDDDWLLSTDIGCIFIGMAGLIDAYEMVPTKDIAETIDVLVARFLEVDLTGIKAQTHATLSALRGLIKYASLTGKTELVDEAITRWHTYVKDGMTCCYGNLNWFGRPDSWTEPCAIVDSYIVATELWKTTGNADFRNMAELIAINAIGHAQRSNGGFGCDNCPSEADPFLTIIIPEASWCCTMRGAEGLVRMAESSWMTNGKTLYMPFYFNTDLDTENIAIKQTSTYPHEGKVELQITRNKGAIDTLKVPDLPWADGTAITINGKSIPTVSDNGFLCITGPLKEGDIINITFDMPLRTDSWNGLTRFYRGPVLLGHNDETAISVSEASMLEPVPHLMEKMDSNHIQVLFR